MDFDVPSFQKLEIIAWILAATIFVLVFGHFLIFVGLCVAIRFFYMRFKDAKLGKINPKNKTVIITGCDSGFGLEFAKRLQKKGANVIATCVNPNSGGRKELSKLEGDNIKIVELDIGNDESVAKCLRIVKDQCSSTGLWGLVNNAGMNYIGDCELTTMTQYLEVGNVNLYGMVRMCKAFLPLLRQAKGRVVNVTSVKGSLPYPSNAQYTITKFGGEAFSEILRQEMSKYGVQVSIIQPGNFGGATGCLNEAGQQRIKRLLDEMWEEASPEAKEFYGEYHLQQQYKEAKDAALTACKDVSPVLDAYEEALFNYCPKVRYVVSGSNSIIDSAVWLAILGPFMPQKFFDKLRAYFFPYKVYRP